MPAIHYQELVQPFPNASAPTTPEGWLVFHDERPIAAMRPQGFRQNLPLQEILGPILPPQPTDPYYIAKIMAAMHESGDALVRRKWRPPESEPVVPLWEPFAGTTVSSVASWLVDDTPPKRTPWQAYRELGHFKTFVAVLPTPGFASAPQTDFVYYRVDQTDTVYLRKTPASFDKAPVQSSSGLAGSVSAIVTRGFTSVGSINLVVTAGYGISGTQSTPVEQDVVYLRVDQTDTVYRRL